MNKGRTSIVACGPFLFLLLSSCGGDNGTPTPEQNRQLANADALLNSAPESLSNIDGNILGPAETNSRQADQ